MPWHVLAGNKVLRCTAFIATGRKFADKSRHSKRDQVFCYQEFYFDDEKKCMQNSGMQKFRTNEVAVHVVFLCELSI